MYTWLSRVRREIKRRTMLTPLDPLISRIATRVAIVGSRFVPSPREESEILIDGDYFLKVPPGLPSARRLRVGMYEPEVTELMHGLLTPGKTLVDVGANVGYYTLMGARLVGEAGRVYAFEPEPAVFKYLALNAARNGAQNVIAVPKAVADGGGSLPFTSSALEGGFLNGPSALLDAPITVDAVSLDGYFSTLGWPSIDVVKLDVEGAEGRVLAGMHELSAKNPELRIVMEYNLEAIRRAGLTSRDVSDVLVQLGFPTAYIIEQGLKPISLANPLPQSGLIYNLLIGKL